MNHMFTESKTGLDNLQLMFGQTRKIEFRNTSCLGELCSVWIICSKYILKPILVKVFFRFLYL